ncbi:hypothetical protein RP726_05790 [Candidatus Methylospira mobilis]|uniref:hypothetical protein n=1 Tax=Candidatus Methylospira mobilis TaxID=1808979 RepID=UPI0028ECA8B7|nr:hypothetical protein [Candidatus Methylospira mobilis]WNV05924.1 hypothetical protein RP726_05790 [Candidatus Methylospira mobilis]
MTFIYENLNKKQRIVLGVVALSVISAGGIAWLTALKPATIDKPQAQSFLSQVSNNKIAVESVFSGPQGLTGVVLQSPTGEKGIGWITEASDQKTSVFIVGGMVLNHEGKNLSVDAYQTHIAGGSAEKVSKKASGSGDLKDIDPFQLKGITLGQGDKTLIAFMDMNCHFCEKLFGFIIQNQDILYQAGVQVRFIPVGILGNDSIRRAVTVLQDENTPVDKEQYNSAALRKLVANYNHQSLHTQEIPPLPEAIEQIVEQVALSTDYLKSISPNRNAATPTLLWSGANGRQVRVSGVSSLDDLKKILQDIQ